MLWKFSSRNKANEEIFKKVYETLLRAVKACGVRATTCSLSLPCISSSEGGRLHLGRYSQEHGGPFPLAVSFRLWYLPRRGRLNISLSH